MLSLNLIFDIRITKRENKYFQLRKCVAIQSDRNLMESENYFHPQHITTNIPPKLWKMYTAFPCVTYWKAEVFFVKSAGGSCPSNIKGVKERSIYKFIQR
jgi:hypothetical protein